MLYLVHPLYTHCVMGNYSTIPSVFAEVLEYLNFNLFG